MKLAICDDEEYYIHKVKCKLTESLRHHGIDDYQIETFLSGKELCSLESGLSEYTVIFLDINMDELNGIEAAKIIRRYNKETLLIFITAFLDYAPEGYKVGAMRYILKDMLDEMLPECMDAIIEKLKVNTKKVCYPFVEGKREIYADDAKKRRLIMLKKKLTVFMLAGVMMTPFGNTSQVFAEEVQQSNEFMEDVEKLGTDVENAILPKLGEAQEEEMIEGVSIPENEENDISSFSEAGHNTADTALYLYGD